MTQMNIEVIAQLTVLTLIVFHSNLDNVDLIMNILLFWIPISNVIASWIMDILL